METYDFLRLNAMKYPIQILAGFLGLMFMVSCSQNAREADAYGNFEADETIISSEASGRVLQFNIHEGQHIQIGSIVAEIDSTQLVLKKKQLWATIKAMYSKLPNEKVQLAAIDEQLKTLEREKNRVERLVKDRVATQKSLDDLNAQIETVKKERIAANDRLDIQKKSIMAETEPIRFQIKQLNDQIQKCRIINPVEGTVLTTLSKHNEMLVAGKPIYTIANLKILTLRAYVTENQLTEIKLGEQLDVQVDAVEGMKTWKGKLVWVSDEAEFTPKMIQTRDERANQVYAIKLEVENEGSLKPGMPAEVIFSKKEKE